MHIEHKLRSTLHALFAVAGLVGPGAVIDAGANNGQDTKWLANLLSSRQVFAVEPLERNIKKIRALADAHSNIVAIRGSLGNTTGTDSYPAALEHKFDQLDDKTRKYKRGTSAGRVTINVLTVDALFADKVLALAHWDVEGAERQVLEGARSTIARDRPFFTVESFPRTGRRLHAELMQAVRALKYQVYEIDESCGRPSDCRNWLCVPNDRVDTFEVARAANRSSTSRFSSFAFLKKAQH